MADVDTKTLSMHELNLQSNIIELSWRKDNRCLKLTCSHVNCLEGFQIYRVFH